MEAAGWTLIKVFLISIFPVDGAEGSGINSCGRDGNPREILKKQLLAS